MPAARHSYPVRNILAMAQAIRYRPPSHEFINTNITNTSCRYRRYCVVLLELRRKY